MASLVRQPAATLTQAWSIKFWPTPLEVRDDVDADRFELTLAANAGQHQELRRLDGARAQQDLAPRRHEFAAVEPHAGGSPTVDFNLVHRGVPQDCRFSRESAGSRCGRWPPRPADRRATPCGPTAPRPRA